MRSSVAYHPSKCKTYGTPNEQDDFRAVEAYRRLRAWRTNGGPAQRTLPALGSESPLEAILLEAFFASGPFECLTRPSDVVVGSGPFGLLLQQVTIPSIEKGHRLDFAIMSAEGLYLAVEVDSHQWHESTLYQVQSDKSRDRKLTAAGWQVLRFTGSEVHRNPEACVREVREQAIDSFVFTENSAFIVSALSRLDGVLRTERPEGARERAAKLQQMLSASEGFDLGIAAPLAVGERHAWLAQMPRDTARGIDSRVVGAGRQTDDGPLFAARRRENAGSGPKVGVSRGGVKIAPRNECSRRKPALARTEVECHFEPPWPDCRTFRFE